MVDHLKTSMTQIFPKSRVHIVEISSFFQEGFQKALSFAKKHNLPINTADGRRLVTSYCVTTIARNFDSIKSSFPKVACLSKKKIPSKLLPFVENYFEGILKQMPISYCGLYDINSPDLECAAANVLKKQTSRRDYNILLDRLKVRKIT